MLVSVEIRSDHTHRFEASAADVWEAIGRTDQFRQWWPWLRRFDAEGLVEGDRWQCTVQPPLPYALRFSITLDEVEPNVRAAATVGGDISGAAELTVTPTDVGCELRLLSTLRPDNRALEVVSNLAPWMARFGHDWVIRTGLAQFRRRAL